MHYGALMLTNASNSLKKKKVKDQPKKLTSHTTTQFQVSI